MRYVVTKAEGIGGDPIPPDEPCLVIRAQDVLAPGILDTYIARYNVLSAGDPGVVEELMVHRRKLTEWQMDHPGHVKVADR